MKKTNSILLILFFLQLNLNAQNNISKGVRLNNYFQQALRKYEADSALVTIERLADQHKQMLDELLHDSFAIRFRKTTSVKDSVFNNNLLDKISASKNQHLMASAKPLTLWMEAKRNKNDAEKLKNVVEQMLDIHAKLPIDTPKSIEKDNRTERYALMIAQIAKANPEMSVLGDTLFNRVFNRIEQIVFYKYGHKFVEDEDSNLNRAYFRFLFAVAYYFKSQAVAQNNAELYEQYLIKASEYAPDEPARNHRRGYYYESLILLNNENDDFFDENYIDFLIKKDKQPEATALLIKMAKAEPIRIETLERYYEKHQIGTVPFKQYWRNILNENRKAAPAFKLKLMDGSYFDLDQHKGKWILIDFWGTWCGPCVAELPTMQKFYEELEQLPDVVLTTIACFDTKERVSSFMKKNKYTFPVAMSDGKIERIYPVDGYPTKILITPEGKRLKIEFGADWVERIKNYRKY